MTSTQPAFDEGLFPDRSQSTHRVSSVAWAVFFIWVGVALLAELHWGWFLLGVGVIVLAAELVRWQMGANVERFWVTCGIVFLAGGLWNILDLPWPIAPILLIVLGAALLYKAVLGPER